jgi:hypothetical protein
MRERFSVKWQQRWVAIPVALIVSNLSRNARLLWIALAHQAQANGATDMDALTTLMSEDNKKIPDRRSIYNWITELETARWLTKYRTTNGNEYELHEPSQAPPLPDPEPEPQAPAGDQPAAPAAPAAVEPDEPPTDDDITWQVFHDELLKLDVKAAHKLQGVAIPNRTQALKHVQAMAAAGARGGAIFNWIRDEGHKPIAVADSESFIERYKHMFERDQPDEPSTPAPTPQPQRTRAPRTTKPNINEVIDADFVGHVKVMQWPNHEQPLCILGFTSDQVKEDFRPHVDQLKEWIAQVSHVAAFTMQATVSCN